jgi:hypothetical protein
MEITKELLEEIKDNLVIKYDQASLNMAYDQASEYKAKIVIILDLLCYLDGTTKEEIMERL